MPAENGTSLQVEQVCGFRSEVVLTNCRLECMICFLIIVTFNKTGQHDFWMNITLAFEVSPKMYNVAN